MILSIVRDISKFMYETGILVHYLFMMNRLSETKYLSTGDSLLNHLQSHD